MAQCPHCFQQMVLTAIVEHVVNGAKQRSMGDIKFLVRGKIEASDKAIYNALGGLARRKRIKRVAYGKYSSFTPCPMSVGEYDL